MTELEKRLFDCKGKSKIHLKSQRLKVNAGMDFPSCKANAKLLDLNAAWLPLSDDIIEVTCKHCRKIYYAKGRH